MAWLFKVVFFWVGQRILRKLYHVVTARMAGGRAQNKA